VLALQGQEEAGEMRSCLMTDSMRGVGGRVEERRVEEDDEEEEEEEEEAGARERERERDEREESMLCEQRIKKMFDEFALDNAKQRTRNQQGVGGGGEFGKEEEEVWYKWHQQEEEEEEEEVGFNKFCYAEKEGSGWCFLDTSAYSEGNVSSGYNFFSCKKTKDKKQYEEAEEITRHLRCLTLIYFLQIYYLLEIYKAGDLYDMFNLVSALTCFL
jgi:hypothetical protein